MFTVTETQDERGSTIELRHGKDSRAEIAAWRGGMVTRLSLGGLELLYLDEATLLDPSKSVRGGIPLLFPSPGRLTQDKWARAGLEGSMKQHGFARTLPWDIIAKHTVAAAVTLQLNPSEITRAQYPWEFQVQLTYALTAKGLRLDLIVANAGTLTMPFGFGIHPYFAIPDREKARVTIPTEARRAWDNVAKREIELTTLDLTASEVDLHLLGHGRTSASLERKEHPAVHIKGSPELSHWVIWTLAGKDFVCVEPWTCPADAINTGASLLEVEPGASRTLWLEISSE